MKLEDICPDFPDWPRRWSGEDKDIPQYAQKTNSRVSTID